MLFDLFNLIVPPQPLDSPKFIKVKQLDQMYVRPLFDHSVYCSTTGFLPIFLKCYYVQFKTILIVHFIKYIFFYYVPILNLVIFLVFFFH